VSVPTMTRDVDDHSNPCSQDSPNTIGGCPSSLPRSQPNSFVLSFLCWIKRKENSYSTCDHQLQDLTHFSTCIWASLACHFWRHLFYVWYLIQAL